MSDSDSGPEFLDCDIRHGAKLIYDKDSPFVALQPPDVIYDRWNKIPVILKKKAAQLMKLYAFWYHILLRQENHNTTRWAVQVGFLDSNVSNDLSLKRLHKIEILEAILRAMEKGCLLEDQTRHMIWISNKFNLHVPEVLDDAIRWLERTGEPRIKLRVQELGPRGNCFAALQLIFTEYAHYTQAMGVDRKKMMRELAQDPGQWSIERSEEMKTRGNDQFQKKKYDAAVKCYSKAIKYHPENHIIYGNRALCYIRCEKYLKAVGDGKRATLIQPEWAKGHYRYCEALFLLGEQKQAIEANEWGQTLCKADPEGMKDLLQQHAKLNIEMEESKCHRAEERKAGRSNKTAAKKVSSKRTESNTRADTTESQQTAKPTSKVEPSAKNTTPENKGLEVKVESQTQPGAGRTHSVDNTKVPKEMKVEMADKNSSKPEPCASEKTKGKNRNQQSKEKAVSGSSRDPSVRDALMSAVQDAHMALADQRCRNAEQAFSQALSILATSTPKELGLCALDQVLLIYGHASALIEIGQPEELAEAQKDFEKIKHFEERKFQCLVFYGIGKAYQKENRFPLALEQFSDSMQMVKKKITPGKLTWPTTKVIVEESKLDYFKVLLEESIEMCKFPPKPDAICRHQNCHGHSKIEIYFTDPDFKGFIRMVCCQSCKVEYHINCWKKLKATAFSDKNEKDFLQGMCFTPDCGGRICHIKIYGSTGLVKCEFEASIDKPMGKATLRVNQKCTSLKKLKSKEDRKLRRKQHRQDASLSTQAKNDEIALENGETIVIEQKASSSTWLAYGDRVLLQISERKDLFRAERHNISVLMENLKPWMDLDQMKGNKLGTSYTERQVETLGDVVELLLEKKNRVWARVFIHGLSGCLDTSPKLHDWAHQLNSAGLNSAALFIDRYADHLEQLDLAPLLNFAPLQDMLIEKFGTMPEFFSRLGLTLTEYLKQAPSQEMRLFIWTLEEHRDQYATCHTVLDDYFEIMDGHCLVIKKTGIENEINSPIKTKNRNRKKKQKEPKGSVIVLSGMRGGTSREEDDEDFLHDSLMFLDSTDSTDPFSIPNHLRNQVAEFEGQYNIGSRSSHYNRILDNNPDPTKESLYDYFAQILEEYGPLGAQDPLLVGELDNFPPDAQQKIHEAGGLEHFLLESLRFVMTDNLLGLMKHAVSLQDANTHRMDNLDFIGDIPNGLSLNPSAMEFLPNSHDSGPGDYDEEPVAIINMRPNPVEFTGYLQVIANLPSPYVLPVFGSPPAPPANEIARAIGTLRAEDKSYNNHDPHNLEDFDLYISGMDEQGLCENVYAPVHSAKAPGKTAVEVQVVTCDALSEVAVNTEPYEPFEGNNGDMNKKEKSNAEFEQQIQQMKQDYGAVKQRRQTEISALEGEQEEINHSIQIIHKELGLFQQKLEEEVKKDQQEKKENQETLKALKIEIKELAESQESISKNIHKKNKEYETQLNTFLELSNQSAAEKMSLEDEIKRCRDLCAKATRRSQGAELSILENQRSRGLRCLYRSLSDARAILAKLKEVSPRLPSQILQSATDAWMACAQEAEEKIRSTEAQYQDQMEQVKRGTRLCTLPPVAVPSAPWPPPVPALQQLLCHPVHMRAPLYSHPGFPRAPPAPAMDQSVALPSGMAGVPASATTKRPITRAPQPNQASRPPAPQPTNVYDRIVDRLSVMFPHYSRPVLSKFIGEMRTANRGCLNSLSYQEVINRVAQLILDHQDSTREQLSSAGRGDTAGTPSRSDSPASVHSTGPPTHVWKSVGAQGHSKSKALNMEDPCIICHEDMSQEDLCVLECRHSFHRECIKSWLKEQSTCPTCREHALLPEDFPLLPGRIRRGHTPAAFS
ncbi:E3 ubiquitin-protein ligase TTC3 [Salvelinus sp. IW2-2015]|uniref:E3 ubiquitin-protein ligase TTC3 n=1 Tax=Salvelinus sp. IW2-2015 TaxID=2691554 RepID=UPI000CDFD63B|nr:E3 ubiquitin-protein ligase TTC3 [Salvelinus alpinus]XP_023869345.1 E3 ubiquitin-protein ligase TTC3 [Salvelinus alpinus]XP_023869346.1 E3 ubiquitin-protein ligase TTC3 [Salvelinus alpinus]